MDKTDVLMELSAAGRDDLFQWVNDNLHETAPKDATNGLHKAHYDDRSIRVEKLSPITDTGCVCEDVLRLIGKPTNRWDASFSCEPIGNNVWRAKIGKRGEWGYGRSINDALDAAFVLAA